jgi:transcriptional regulator with XRE-family HTH domain
MTQTLSGQVAATIRAEMARRKVSQAQVADAIGVSQAAISRRLGGQTPFELDELTTVAGLLDMAVGDLIESNAA